MENELTEHGAASLSQVLDAAAQLAPSSASSGVTQNINTGNGTQICTVNDGVTIAEGTIINGGLSFGDGATVNVFNGITPESLLDLLPMLQKMFGIKPNNLEPDDAPMLISHKDEWNSLSSECFCLFVLDKANYNSGHFAMSASRSLEKYTKKEYYDKYHRLKDEHIEAIKQMPCIFAKKNVRFKDTDEDHPVIIGKLTDIIVSDDVIMFTFDAYEAFQQSVINKNIEAFHLCQSRLSNELDVEHWSIRPGDLKGIIEKFQIEVK